MMMTSRTSVLTLEFAPQMLGGCCVRLGWIVPILNRSYDGIVPPRARLQVVDDGRRTDATATDGAVSRFVAWLPVLAAASVKQSS